MSVYLTKVCLCGDTVCLLYETIFLIVYLSVATIYQAISLPQCKQALSVHWPNIPVCALPLGHAKLFLTSKFVNGSAEVQ